MPEQAAFVVTCEHGGHDIPPRWKKHFAGAEDILASHRGWDPGALGAARRLAKALAAPLIHSTTSRLLVDLNRSLHHASCYSEFTRGLPAAELAAIADQCYLPFRSQVAGCIGAQPRGTRVVHLSVHSFTPVLNGVTRTADFALLYDPARAPERRFAGEWLAALGALTPEFRLRRNYPYLGRADGHTTALRRQLPTSRYLGIELEFNHGLLADRAAWARLVSAVIRSCPLLPR